MRSDGVAELVLCMRHKLLIKGRRARAACVVQVDKFNSWSKDIWEAPMGRPVTRAGPWHCMCLSTVGIVYSIALARSSGWFVRQLEGVAKLHSPVSFVVVLRL